MARRRTSALYSSYTAAKREYHRLGDQLYRSRHAGKSISETHKRKRKSKSRRSR